MPRKKSKIPTYKKGTTLDVRVRIIRTRVTTEANYRNNEKHFIEGFVDLLDVHGKKVISERFCGEANLLQFFEEVLKQDHDERHRKQGFLLSKGHPKRGRRSNEKKDLALIEQGNHILQTVIQGL